MSNPEMNCRRAEVLINQRLDREIQSAQNAQLDRHLHDCPSCARNMRQARGLEVLLATLEVPTADAARQATRDRVAQMLAKPNVITFRPPQVVRRTSMRWAVAALFLLVALGSFVGYMMLRPNPQPAVVETAFPVRFSDRPAIWESLNQNAVAAASNSGVELARVHQDLSNQLTGAMLFERVDAVAEHEAGVAYLRTLHRAIVPEIREGLIATDQTSTYSSQREVLRALGARGDATASAAEALNAYTLEQLQRPNSERPLVAMPDAGTSLVAALSETSLDMREITSPAQRAERLSQLAARVVAEAETSTPAVAARLRSMAVKISTDGIQPQVRRAAGDPVARAQLGTVLREDAKRLSAIQKTLEQTATPQAEGLRAAILGANISNAVLQEEIKKETDKTPAPDTEKNPGAALPDAAAPQVLPGVVVTPVDAGGKTPALVVAPATGVDKASDPAKGGETQALPNNANSGDGSSANPGGKPADAGAGKATAPGLNKENPSGRSVEAKADAAAAKDARSLDKPSGKDNAHPETSSEKAAHAAEAVTNRNESAAAGKPEHAEKVERPEKPDRPERPERPEAPERPDRPDKVERPERPDKPEKPDQPGQTVNGQGNGSASNGNGAGNGNGNGTGNGNNGGNGNGNGTGNGNGNGTGNGNGAGNGNGNGAGNGNGNTGGNGNGNTGGNGNGNTGGNGNGNAGGNGNGNGNAGGNGNGNAGGNGNGNGNGHAAASHDVGRRDVPESRRPSIPDRPERPGRR